VRATFIFNTSFSNPTWQAEQGYDNVTFESLVLMRLTRVSKAS